MNKKISWPAYKALFLTGIVVLFTVLPLAVLGIAYLGYLLGKYLYVFTQ